MNRPDQQWRQTFIAVGSNLGDRIKNCRNAIFRICGRQGIRFKRASSFYETAPVGINSKRWFINGVFEVESILAPLELIEVLLEIEAEMGRDRSLGPDRIIDLDLLNMKGVTRRPDESSNLELPHPRFPQRAFVLMPWSEIAPGCVAEGYKQTIRQLLNRLDVDGGMIRKVEDF